MGLLKAGAGALGGVLADQWRDYFYCDALEAGVLAAKGKKRTSRRSSNTKGDENIISNGSILAVNEGQCMLIVEQGKIVEVCAEAGEFLYDSGSCGSVAGDDNGFDPPGEEGCNGGFREAPHLFRGAGAIWGVLGIPKV